VSGLPAGVGWLFCPADRPERFEKAANAADVVILDLEDGVAPHRRARARQAIRSATAVLDPRRTVVRLNSTGSEDHRRDLEALAGLAFDTVMLAKAESPHELAALMPKRVVALCETARGIEAVADIAAAPNCVALIWGAEDLTADLGGSSSKDASGGYRPVMSYARSKVLLTAAAAGLPAIDAVFLTIDDLEGLRRESEDAAQSGFAAKACIHPAHIREVRLAYRPRPEELDWARRVVAANNGSASPGVLKIDGKMVDQPVLRHARRVLSRAGEEVDDPDRTRPG
jgi:citrate lyase subunit beta / citryl-CoA lyase